MKFITNISVRPTALRLIRVMGIDASLGAACGALYGFVFGGFGAIVHSEAGRLVSIAGYLALFGAVAGAVVGACGAILNSGEKTPGSMPVSRNVVAAKQNRVEAVRHLMVPSQRQAQDNLAAASRSDRRRFTTVASKHPLCC